MVDTDAGERDVTLLTAYTEAGEREVSLLVAYTDAGERGVPLLMADTREAGELRAGYVPGEDCQGADIRARGLAWAHCHLKGQYWGTVSGLWR
jgi:hypothetical protein